MVHTSPSSSFHTCHQAPADPHHSPGRLEIATLEFEMFAETIRQDLAPASLLEHVLTERVVAAAWQIHVGSLDENGLTRAGGSFAVGSKALQQNNSLESALNLLKAARETLNPRWGSAEHPATIVTEADVQDELDGRFDPLSVDNSNEWPYLADEDADDEFEVETEIDEDSDIPVRWQDRLVFDFSISETSPVLKGTWVTVSHVVSLIVDGWTWSDVLRDHPELTEEDVRTCLAYTVEQDNRGEY